MARCSRIVVGGADRVGFEDLRHGGRSDAMAEFAVDLLIAPCRIV